jgi:hypothetical protein
MADLSVRDEGTIFLLTPETAWGEEWIAEHIPDTAFRFGGAIVVEHRYIADIVAGAINDGLEVE